MSDVLVLKIGGSVQGEEGAALDVVATLNDSGHSLVVVHGAWASRRASSADFA